MRAHNNSVFGFDLNPLIFTLNHIPIILNQCKPVVWAKNPTFLSWNLTKNIQPFLNNQDIYRSIGISIFPIQEYISLWLITKKNEHAEINMLSL